MIEPIKVFDEFYEPMELGLVCLEAHLNNFNTSYQPGEAFVQNRLNAYPCYETKLLNEESSIYKILHSKLNLLLDNKIERLHTRFRKIYKNELENKSIFKNMSLKHQDEKQDIAIVIYLNNFNIMDGTKLYTMGQNQFDPDIVIGAKPNRLIMYKSETWHEPCIDLNTELRVIQVAFIQLKK